MDKLKKYNQILYAALGSIALLWLIAFGIYILSEIIRESRYDGDPDTLVTEEEARELADQDLRKQIVSMEAMQNFDTTNKIYLIPITHKTLDELQQREKVSYGLLDLKSGGSRSYYYSRYFNNLMLYDFINNSSHILFNERINIDRFQSVNTPDDHLILVTGWKEDTNDDGSYNELDQKLLYLYIHSLRELRPIDLRGFKFVEFQYLEEADQLVISVIYDINGDGKYSLRQDPEILLHYSIKERTLKKLVGDDQLNQLQDLIDGAVN